MPRICREILCLRSRAISTLIENYSLLFHLGPQILDQIPKTLRKEIFNRLVFRGVLELPLFSRVIDQNMSILDLKSVSSFRVNNDAVQIIKGLGNLRTLLLTEIGADSEVLSQMFSNLYKLLRLELTKSPCFNDSVLEKVSECCPCLKILNINRTGISDIGLESIYNNKLCLVGLDLGYTKITYQGISWLGRDNCRCKRTLKELKCRGTLISNRDDILGVINLFEGLEDYSFDFESSDDASWVLSRVLKKPKNCTFNIVL